MVISTLKIVSAPGSRAAVVRTLTAHLNSTRVQPGCRQCNVYRDVSDGQVLILVEEWESQAALHLRLASEEYRIVLKAMERSQETPVIHFDTVSSRAGIELIEAARREAFPKQERLLSEDPNRGIPPSDAPPVVPRPIVRSRRSASTSHSCRQCGRRAPGPYASPLGLCDRCERTIAEEVHLRVRRMQEALEVLEDGEDSPTKLAQCDRILQEAEALQRYEARGIFTTVPMPSTLLKDFQAKRDALAPVVPGAHGAAPTSGECETRLRPGVEVMGKTWHPVIVRHARADSDPDAGARATSACAAAKGGRTGFRNHRGIREDESKQ